LIKTFGATTKSDENILEDNIRN